MDAVPAIEVLARGFVTILTRSFAGRQGRFLFGRAAVGPASLLAQHQRLQR